MKWFLIKRWLDWTQVCVWHHHSCAWQLHILLELRLVLLPINGLDISLLSVLALVLLMRHKLRIFRRS